MINVIFLAVSAAEAAEKATIFDIKTILVYYAIGCLVLLPFYIIFIIYLCKKRPEVIQKLNARLDRMLGIEPQQKAEEIKDENQKGDSAEPTKPSKTIEEENDEMGVSTMMLKVGDTYKCYVSESDQKHISGSRFTWKNTDEFVGKIDEMTGRFEALKVGQSFIECADKRIYYVIVKPNAQDWFAEKLLRLVLDNMDIVNITANFISKKILDLNEDSRIISYEGWEPGMKSVTFEYNKRKETVRFLLALANNQPTFDSICSNIAEYMNPIDFEKNSKVTTKYWVHKSGEGDDSSVDYVAFLKLGSDGLLYFGVGECWRIGADEIEIQSNPDMVDRSFKNILPSAEVPKAVRTTVKNEKPKKPKKTKPEANVPSEEHDEDMESVSDASEIIPESTGEEEFEDYVPDGQTEPEPSEEADPENVDENPKETDDNNGEPADPFADYHEGNNGQEAGFEENED